MEEGRTERQRVRVTEMVTEVVEPYHNSRRPTSSDIKFVPVLAQVILYITFLVPSTLRSHVCLVWTRR